MATVLLVGTDAALLEGLAQSLAAAGHVSRFALSIAEAASVAAAELPMVAVVERSLAVADPSVMALPLALGGALLLYHTTHDSGGLPSSALHRAALADLTLPLERHRLVALIHRVEERALTVGRERRQPPHEPRAP
jgi:DNA-binding NtrC family response regulator